MTTISSSTTSSTAYKVAADTTGTLILQTGSGPTTAVTIDASQNVGVGVTPSAWLSTAKALDIGSRGSLVDWSTSQQTDIWSNGYFNGTNSIYKTTANASIYRQSVGQHIWFNAPSGTAGNAITFTQAMTLDASGNLLVGTTSGSQHVIYKATSSTILTVTSNTGTDSVYINGVGSTGANLGQSAAVYAQKSSITSRSINAGGTINASGADYAEYMTKADNFVLAKGDVVGINANGKLTNVFADAISFMVKSTDPSYVGGDAWGTEESLGLILPKQPVKREKTEEVEAETDAEFAVRKSQYEADKTVFDAAVEAARQTVDRIAFAGQVPVNVTGATAGQYIVPVNDNGAIKGEAVSNPTFEQYQQAVGKVIAIEQDGRARIIVKVA